MKCLCGCGSARQHDVLVMPWLEASRRKLDMLRPRAVLMAYWSEVLAIEEDAVFLDPVYVEAA